MMQYLLIASKDGNLQFSHYFVHTSQCVRTTNEARVIGKCLEGDRDLEAYMSSSKRGMSFVVVDSDSVAVIKYDVFFSVTHFEHLVKEDGDLLCFHLALEKYLECHFLEDGDFTLVFRWFGPCLFIIAADKAENELMIYEFLSLYVNALHRYFGKFSERHVLFNIDRLHMVLEEMVVDGEIVETSIKNALSPIQMLDTVSR